MSAYKRVVEENPHKGLELLRDGVKEALSELSSKIETPDLEVLANKLTEVTKSLDTLTSQQRASQEASKQFYEKAVASLGEIAKIKLEASYEASEPLDVQALLDGMAKLIPEPISVPAPVEPVDIEGIIEQVFRHTQKKPPKYKFEVERNHSGVLVGITATPEEGI